MTNKVCYMYRAEGNINLVVSIGKKLVYRLFKKTATNKEHNRQKELQENQQKIIDYVKNVMKPLLGEEFVTEGELLTVSTSEMNQIQEMLNSQPVRPNYRLHKFIDASCNIAVKLPDFCFIVKSKSEAPTFAVEIKPKCGFVSNAEAHDDKLNINESTQVACQYCRFQYVKLRNKRCESPSQYCPLDLFSGDDSRMQYALQGLFRSPQNNLRVFVNGELLHGEDCKSDELYDLLEEYFPSKQEEPEESGIKGFCDVILKCLLHENPANKHLKDQSSLGVLDTQCNKYLTTTQQKCNASSAKHSVDNSCHSLPEGCVLNKVQKAQLLGNVDNIYETFKKVDHFFSRDTKYRKQSLVDGPYDQYMVPCTAFEDKEINQAIDKMKRYMVARTAMDCQIMVTIQPLKRGEIPADGAKFLNVVHSTHSYQFHVAVIDMDPKPMDRIEGYIQRRKEATEAYQKITQGWYLILGTDKVKTGLKVKKPTP